MVFLVCTNFQCIAHNFLHLPFFTRRWMNVGFSLVNTLLLGVPQTAYKYHHLNHHRYNSDLIGPDGTTRDLSSIYRFSVLPPGAESFLRYTFLGPIRGDVVALYREAAQHGEAWLAKTEVALWVLIVAVILWRDPWFTVAVYLPIWYLGQAASYGENYLEHVGATPGNRKTDSVSCYSRWYNIIWFNNGYHQEHHWRPQVHWSQVPSLRRELEDAGPRRVVAHAHWFNWPRIERR